MNCINSLTCSTSVGNWVCKYQLIWAFHAEVYPCLHPKATLLGIQINHFIQKWDELQNPLELCCKNLNHLAQKGEIWVRPKAIYPIRSREVVFFRTGCSTDAVTTSSTNSASSTFPLDLGQFPRGSKLEGQSRPNQFLCADAIAMQIWGKVRPWGGLHDCPPTLGYKHTLLVYKFP